MEKYIPDINENSSLSDILFEKNTALMMNSREAYDFASSLYTSPKYFGYFDRVSTDFDMFMAICYDIAQHDSDAMELARMPVSPYSEFYNFLLRRNLFGQI